LVKKEVEKLNKDLNLKLKVIVNGNYEHRFIDILNENSGKGTIKIYFTHN
jgi:hypothetical protein